MNDIQRAQYLLEIEYKIKAWAEEEREQNMEMANWVFETRCEIEEAEEKEELLAIQMEIQSQYDEIVEDIATKFEELDSIDRARFED